MFDKLKVHENCNNCINKRKDEKDFCLQECEYPFSQIVLPEGVEFSNNKVLTKDNLRRDIFIVIAIGKIASIVYLLTM